MTFYINAMHWPKGNSYKHQYIGLFTNNERTAEGYFCGWYGAEYYNNTTLIAYGIQNRDGGKPYNPKAPFDGGIEIVNEHYDKIMIGSSYWEVKFEAKNIDEAIQIFKNQSYPDWH